MYILIYFQWKRSHKTESFFFCVFHVSSNTIRVQNDRYITEFSFLGELFFECFFVCLCVCVCVWYVDSTASRSKQLFSVRALHNITSLLSPWESFFLSLVSIGFISPPLNRHHSKSHAHAVHIWAKGVAICCICQADSKHTSYQNRKYQQEPNR